MAVRVSVVPVFAPGSMGAGADGNARGRRPGPARCPDDGSGDGDGRSPGAAGRDGGATLPPRGRRDGPDRGRPPSPDGAPLAAQKSVSRRTISGSAADRATACPPPSGPGRDRRPSPPVLDCPPADWRAAGMSGLGPGEGRTVVVLTGGGTGAPCSGPAAGERRTAVASLAAGERGATATAAAGPDASPPGLSDRPAAGVTASGATRPRIRTLCAAARAAAAALGVTSAMTAGPLADSSGSRWATSLVGLAAWPPAAALTCAVRGGRAPRGRPEGRVAGAVHPRGPRPGPSGSDLSTGHGAALGPRRREGWYGPLPGPARRRRPGRDRGPTAWRTGRRGARRATRRTGRCPGLLGLLAPPPAVERRSEGQGPRPARGQVAVTPPVPDAGRERLRRRERGRLAGHLPGTVGRTAGHDRRQGGQRGGHGRRLGADPVPEAATVRRRRRPVLPAVRMNWTGSHGGRSRALRSRPRWGWRRRTGPATSRRRRRPGSTPGPGCRPAPAG